jgi:2,4-dienoyl-CoA reductase-like NADH-dependent reductase (Old Yellow Enzyme family)
MPIMIQLGHAGRKASSYRPWEGGQLQPPADGGWEVAGPSAIPQLPNEAAPKAYELADLKRIRQAFVDAAKRSVRIGFDGIELHSAHGYLLHQFFICPGLFESKNRTIAEPAHGQRSLI